MCGIGGILRTDGQPIPEEWLDAIDARIAYRGPDGHGRFRARVEIDDPNAPGGKRIVEVAFVHRRLSIIDHKDGVQPMVSQRGRNDKEGLVAVVFNGCIYNHRALRRELEGEGHRFVTDHSDTEVLIHGWREWRQELIKRLEGMFTFAIWDRGSAVVCMGRDTFGEKPLFYPTVPQAPGDPEMFAFSSEVGSILNVWRGQHASWRDTNPWNVEARFLQCGYTDNLALSQDNTMALDHPPGIAITIPFVLKHQEVHARPDQPLRTHPGADPEYEALIDHSVAQRLEADVPIGCFLSGGVDSSLIAHFAKKHKHDILTFCVRMPDARYDESAFAEAVARHLQTNHHTLDVAIAPSDDLQFLVRTLGQPFGDSSILPTYWVSKAARQYAKVALSGDGGDELFMGYERYLVAQRLAQGYRWFKWLPKRLLERSHPKSMWHKIARFIDALRDYEKLGLLALNPVFRPKDIDELLGRSSRVSLPADDSTSTFVNVMPRHGEHPSIALRKWDIANYLPNDLLRKVDTASMACGLEVRCPFLDRDLARAALAAPIEQLMPGGQRKGLLRQIARKYLPKEIVDRPKMGFAIPIGEWFRNDDLPARGGGMKTLLLDHLNSAEPFGPIQLNRKAVQRFIDEHMSGKRDHGQRLFTLLTLSIWAGQMGKAQSTKHKG